MSIRNGRFIFCFMSFLGFTLLIHGCGGGASDAPATIPVSGTIKYKGEPVKQGTINFAPVDQKKSRAAQATINENGSFETRPEKGLMVGEYQVSVLSHTKPLHEIPPAELSKLGDSIYAVPKKYSEFKTSGLTVKIEQGDSSKELNFDLTDQFVNRTLVCFIPDRFFFETDLCR